MQVQDLSGTELDEWVARVEGHVTRNGITYDDEGMVTGLLPNYCIDWARGGPIIERERIYLSQVYDLVLQRDIWKAVWGRNASIETYGSTLLEAAMRCFVASCFGSSVGDAAMPASGQANASSQSNQELLPAAIDLDLKDRDAWV